MRQLLANVIQSAVDQGADIKWAPHYCEPGYNETLLVGEKPSGIYFANWNPKSFTPLVSTIESRIGALLEHYDIPMEWSDEWDTCCDCGGAIQTQPDSYFWKPSYVLFNDYEIICESCVFADLDSYEEQLLNDPNRADTLDVDWSSRGWRRYDAKFETGFHSGQTDNPQEIFDQLTNTLTDPPDILFSIDSVGQFETNWSAWIRAQ